MATVVMWRWGRYGTTIRYQMSWVREQGWCSGDSTCLPSIWPELNFPVHHHTVCGLSLLVLYSVLRGFSLATPVLPSHLKPTLKF